MINLLTYPDVTYTGVNIALFNSAAELQKKISVILSDSNFVTNITLYDLQNSDKHINYNLSVLNLADLIILQNPDVHTWFTGYLLSKINCYYLEYDSSTLNTLYKVSLRQLTDENIQRVITSAIQRKCDTALQFLSATSSGSL